MAWGSFTIYMMVAAIRTNPVLFIVFVLLTITLFLLAFDELNGSTGLSKAGGYLRVLTALGAWYASFSIVANYTFKRTILPVGPKG